MQFLAPLGLLSLLALVLPIVIHLLSRHAGKIVKVGSLRFLLSSTSVRFKSLKLSELTLLFLRLVLLVLLAMMLAQPVWLKETGDTSASARGPVWVAPELLASAHRPRVWPVLDSLVANRHELRLFSTGFPALHSGDSTLSVMDERNNWSLLRELDQTLPASTLIQVLAANRLQSYRGERPNLQHEVAWKTLSTSSPRRWLQAAQRFQQDSLRVVIGFSKSNQTRFAWYFFRMPAQRSMLSAEGMPPLEYIPPANGAGAVLRLVQSEGLNEEKGFRFPVETDSIRVAIVHTMLSSEEARYLETALHAVREAACPQLRIRTALPGAGKLRWEDFDFIFWLAEEALPAVAWQRIEQGLTLVTVAPGPEYETCASWMVMPRAGASSFPRLWRRSPASEVGVPVWTDGFGVALLEAERRGAGWHYRFASRFDPAWNELVLHAAFPEWLLALLRREDIFSPRETGQHDLRRLSAAQSAPQKNKDKNFPSPRFAAHALHFPLWVLAIVIFGMERWMSDWKRN